MKSLFFTFLGLYLGLSANLFAGLSELPYYPPSLDHLKNTELKEELQKAILQKKVLSYKQARRELFGSIYLEKDSSGYYVEDTYCEERYDSKSGVGPGRIPNHTILNCEHTWPQSRFNHSQSSSAQKSDLHHLFPVNSVANSTRGNIPFGEVNGDYVRNCQASSRGSDTADGGESFEPSKYHKGNVARALFYFALRYKLDIDPTEEAHLRAWHRLDPVDQKEIERHEMIYQIQGNRNPFIDDETLIDRIDNI
ncbi:MAG: endonuclease [Bdellovibrionota bacterium]|nr:endonuclease [Bdellovibrionota bacterium]